MVIYAYTLVGERMNHSESDLSSILFVEVMHVVALLSGGKDSIFNVMKCIDYGHKIVCVGNLRPASLDTDELDSNCFQTVGWNGVELMAKAMHLPFYFTETRGKSKQDSVHYDHLNIKADDEVEDLFKLLKKVRSKHPEINAVSTGAILSNYQRSRVESVCQRLELVNLSYLWQRTDQRVLLKEMIDRRIDAIIIKFASMGLSPHQFLGKSIQNRDVFDKLCALEDLYAMNVCGEGGEYESFVLDCPLFEKYKISIDKSSVCGDVNNPISPNGHLKFLKLSLIPKKTHKKMVQRVEEDEVEQKSSWKLSAVAPFAPFVKPKVIQTTNICNYGSKNGIFQFVAHPNVSINHKYISDLDVKNEVNVLMNALILKLNKYKMSIDNLFYCHLFLNDMSLFNTVNPIYKSYFKQMFPPSRVCCQIDLNHGHRVSLEALAYQHKTQKDKHTFDCLHIQSISEWAPTCIGPYSQASKIENKFVFCAGIIGLVPATMQMIKNEAPQQQIDAAMKNLTAVLTAFDSDICSSIHHNIFVLSAPQTEAKSKQMDPFLFGIVQQSAHKFMMNDVLQLNAVIIYVPDLPKHALIEIQSLALTTTCIDNLKTIQLEMGSSKFKASQEGNNGGLPRQDDDSSQKTVKLKYAHLKRKKKQRVTVGDIYAICKEVKENEIGNCFCVKTRAIYNAYDKWCSFVSICELSSQQNGQTISKLIKSALAQSILNLNGYGHNISNQNENDVTEWTERSIVFLRIYYHSEALEPKGLLDKIEECFGDIGIDKVPAISLIPCRGVCFVNEEDPNHIDNNFGLFMLHCFLHEL